MNTRWRQKKKITGYTFSKLQIWNASDTMVSFILPLLKEFKKMNRHGYPDRDEATDTPEKWEAILDRMIYSFDQIHREYPDSPRNLANERMLKDHPDVYDYTLEKETRTMHYLHQDWFKEYFTKAVNEEELAYRKRVEEGLLLFGKYLQDLWD